jgi:hypothetical protein
MMLVGPHHVTLIVIQWRAPQVMGGWTANPRAPFDAADNAPRPSIEITFVSSLLHARAAWMQVRLAGKHRSCPPPGAL